jgi:hypothetical protein
LCDGYVVDGKFRSERLLVPIAVAGTLVNISDIAVAARCFRRTGSPTSNPVTTSDPHAGLTAPQSVVTQNDRQPTVASMKKQNVT